jgi:Ca2+-binding EF-hand superfamily protein
MRFVTSRNPPTTDKPRSPTEALRHPGDRAELRANFRRADLDHDGRISLAEFRSLLETLDSEMSPEEIAVGFAELDTDHDASIGFDEFVAWWARD